MTNRYAELRARYRRNKRRGRPKGPSMTNTPDKSEMRAEELKNCPFCGAQALTVSTRAAGLHWWHVECDNEECRAHGPERGGREEAEREWNTRASPRPPADQVPDMHDALECARRDLNHLAAKYDEQEFVAPTICKIAALQAVPAASGEVRDIRPALLATGEAAAMHLKTALRYKEALGGIQSCYPKNSNAYRIASAALKASGEE